MDLDESERATGNVRVSDPQTGLFARSPAVELPRAVSEALSDPIVRALMAADGIDRESVEHLMRRVIAGLDGKG